MNLSLISYLVYSLVFVFGLAVGSFLNCVIYRLEKNESFLKGRSYCPHCKHILGWKDLIPVFSFLILKGKCRYCHQKISLQYPLVELSTAIIFLFIWLKFYAIAQNFNLFFYLIISCFLILIFVYDLKHYIIPDKIIYPAILIAFLYNILYSYFTLRTPYFILNSIYSALGAAGFFLLIFLISKGKWLGFGDVKLAFFMGFFLGFPNILVALFFAFFSGAIIGIGLIISGKKTLKSEVPFGPFLVAGTFITLFLGETTINWYLNLFLV